MATPTNQETIKTTQAFISLDESFSSITLGKQATFVPPDSIESALSALGNDKSKLLAMISDGMRSEAIRQLRENTSAPWCEKNEDGSYTDAFEGKLADSDAVNDLRMTFARTMFGYVAGRGQSDAVKASNKVAKEKAMAFIRENEAIVKGLQANAVKA